MAIISRTLAASATVGTSFAPLYTDGSFDVTIDASAGDTIEVGASILWASGNNFTYIDAAVMVGGSPVRYVSSASATPYLTTSGIFALFDVDTSGASPTGGSWFYQVQAGDIVAGQVTFRLYGRVISGTRALLAGHDQIMWASSCSSAPTVVSLSGQANGTWTAYTGSITLSASAGDVVALTPSGVTNPNGTNRTQHDIATIVSGSPVNWVSTAGSTHSTGVRAWAAMQQNYEPISGTILYTVQAGDIVTGQVTFQMYGQTYEGGTRTLDSGSRLAARVVGHVPVSLMRSVAFAAPTVNTSWSALQPDGAFDVVIPASAGDVIELGLSMASPVSGSTTYMDASTIVSGSAVNWISSKTSTNNAGVTSWMSYGSYDYTAIGGSILYQVQPADIDGSTVRFRLYAKSYSGTRTFPCDGNTYAQFYALPRVATASSSAPSGSSLSGWGIVSSILPSEPVSTFSPLDLPLGAWYSAESIAQANGSAVSSWTDSANSLTASVGGTVPTLATASTPSGTASVAFNGGYYAMPSGVFQAAAEAAGYYPGEGPEKAFDGSASTQWTDTDFGSRGYSWLLRTADAPAALTSYTINGLRSSYSVRCPTAWILQGSNDRTTWTDLDMQTNVTWATNPLTFPVSNPGEYKVFRIYITAAASAIVNIVDMTLTGPTFTPQTSGEAWFVVKSNEAAGGNWRGLSLLSSQTGSLSHYPSSGSTTIYESALINTRISYVPTKSITNWRVYRIQRGAGGYKIWLDNALQYSGSEAFGYSLTPLLGCNGNASFYLVGNIADFMSMKRELTSGEATDLYSWILAERGVGNL